MHSPIYSFPGTEQIAAAHLIAMGLAVVVVGVFCLWRGRK